MYEVMKFTAPFCFDGNGLLCTLAVHGRMTDPSFNYTVGER